MRVLFATGNWVGDYFCTVPMAWALQAAGHDVRYACPPEQADAISRAGLVPVPVLVGADMLSLARLGYLVKSFEGTRILPNLPLPLHPLTGARLADLDGIDVRALQAEMWEDLSAVYIQSFDAAVEVAKAWRPSLVFHDLMTQEGALAARIAGAPAVYHPPGLYGVRETIPALDHLGPPDPTGSFRRHGVASWSREQIEYVMDPSPEPSLPPLGDALRIPVRYLPYNGPGEMPAWTLDKPLKPRVCVYWGGSAPGVFGMQVAALRHAIDAVADSGSELLLITHEAQARALGTLPPETQVLCDFPLHLSLSGCTAIVHHGGGNVLMTAAAMGIPQLALAITDDQIAISERLGLSGAVAVLPGLTATAEQIRAAVAKLLADPLNSADAADRLRAQIASQPTPAQLVAPLEQLASEGGLDADALRAAVAGA
jgi:UDP:flavonoid glycosyltransferase YjiC (YdhE family)